VGHVAAQFRVTRLSDVLDQELEEREQAGGVSAS